MSSEVIKQLQEAVQFSPENVPLRLHLAQVLLQDFQYQQAEEQYRKVLELSHDNIAAQLGLARTFYHQQKYSVAIVVLEQLEHQEPDNFDALLLHCRILVKENSMEGARDIYQHLLQLNPGFRDEALDGYFRAPQQQYNPASDEDGEDIEKIFTLEKPEINFNDVGGMEREKQEIDLKIIKPLQFPDLYKAYGKKAGGGILLYGPPGCGKTYLARATAGQIQAEFINVGIHDVLDMWIGNSEKNLHSLFELARESKPCVLFFDEVDALGANRTSMRNSGASHLINQFLSEMDGIAANNENVLIIGATNAPWSLDPAFRRPGRFDRIIFVAPPDQEGREEILKIQLRNKPVDSIDYRAIAKATPGYSGADLKAIVDLAIEDKLMEALQKGIPQPITQKDLLKATKLHRATTREWFNTARNYALYSNEAGLYDEVLKYLDIKK
ncbi:Tetratricopeptide repeat-containing protein [Chitinophaga jiangningensis]|uniref:Tetratricopeptide repeat-containing protein n=1 Tax=Chitinophaga jiangningensis TaxID=1419482 RepID=A0A1M7DTY3_9BACT|nr:ATP-binding protein [Chitinophaga jiangningensis]SHL82955.1 Tetratricopeptide repeat-containing protein [Chitinophaga jiangningensis]